MVAGEPTASREREKGTERVIAEVGEKRGREMSATSKPVLLMLPPGIVNESRSSITESSIMTARNLVKGCRSKGELVWY